MGFLYETHMHTCQGSACGVSTGREHIRRHVEAGYTGIIITDHFFGGNTAAPRTGKWTDRVRAFTEGYRDALEEGERQGLQVFFGWEQCYGDDEYLVYGLDEAWLLEHPEIEHCSRGEQLRLVHEGGGCVVQAHPFRWRPRYMHTIRVGRLFCDAVEVVNGGNPPVQDIYAMAYARQHHLVMTAGSDNHNSWPRSGEVPLFGVVTQEKLGDVHDYVRLILSGRSPGLHFPRERLEEDITGQSLPAPLELTADEDVVPMDPLPDIGYKGA